MLLRIAAVCGVTAGTVSLAIAAYPAVAALWAPRPSSIHVGRVADMPDIRDGIPALKTSSAAETAPASPGEGLVPPTPMSPIPKPAVRTVAIPPAGAEPAPAVERAAPAIRPPDAAVTGALSPPLSTPSPAFTPVATPAPAAQPQSRQATAAPAPAVATPRPPAAQEPPARPAPEPAAKPPARAAGNEAKPSAEPKPAPVKAVPVKPAPKPALAEKPAPAEKPATPARVVRRDRPDAAEPRQRTAAAQAEPAASPPATPKPEEPNRFLGVPIPDFAPAGRAIRETVDAVGDAVVNFPKNF
ncbi:MAG: chemotaxis protein CheA [Methylobacterium frigidaeris]